MTATQSTSQGQTIHDAHFSVALAGSDHPARQRASDTQTACAGGASASLGASRSSASKIQTPRGDQTADQDHCSCDARTSPVLVGPILADPTLAFAADVLDDLEKTRNANANRLRIMTRTEADADGELRGFGLDATHPDVARMEAIVTTLDQLVKDAAKTLERAVRRHPLGPWIKAQRGIGDKQAGRLLAAIGDPWWNTLHARPRTVSELWAYAGLATDGVAAVRRQRGVKSNWSTVAKTRAWLCIESCMKQLDRSCKGETGIAVHVDGCACSPYRVVVDERRARTAVTHPDWSPGHSLNDAMRIASKALLRDLWEQARALHNPESA